MGSRGGVEVLIVLVAGAVSGCSCGATVLDSSRPVGGTDAGIPDGPAAEARTRPDGSVIDGATALDAGIGGPHSGSRIKVRGLQTGDALIPTGVLWDDARGVQCSPTLAADGTERCLPLTGQRSVWFTDSSCKNPVIVAGSPPDPCARPDPHPYAIVDDQLACPPTGFKVYGKGAQVNAPAELYTLSRLGCGLVAADQSSSTFYDAVPSLSTDWVRFRRDLTKVTTELGIAYWDGTDGSRVLDGLRLLPDEIPCGEMTADGSIPVPPVNTNAVARCVPSNRVALTGSYFTDETCHETVGLTLECKKPDLIEGLPVPGPGNPSPCSGASTTLPLLRAVAVPSTSVYATVGVGVGPGPDAGSCNPTPYGGFFYYGAGAPVQFEDYPVVTVAAVGTGRFQEVQTSSDGHELYVQSNELYDNKTATLCRPDILTGDGRTFCVSDTAIATLFPSNPGSFGDQTCTTLLAASYGPCNPEPLAVQVPDPIATSCSHAPLRKVLGLHVGPTYSTQPLFGPGSDAGSCTRDPPSSGNVSYDLGGVVDPATLFPLLTPRDL